MDERSVSTTFNRVLFVMTGIVKALDELPL